MARTDHEPDTGIDTTLIQAKALTGAYQGYDTDAALNRVRVLADSGTGPGPAAPVASRYPTVHEQAAHDLDLASSLIVDAPQAQRSISLLVESDPIEPEGALVFAALLHLSGHRDPAQFWFEFAAGAGNRTAAFCLTLLHQQRSEHRTADHWRTLIPTPEQATPQPAADASPPPALLPDRVRRDLITRCWQGRRPCLPPRLKAVIHGLPTEPFDEDFGEIPRPDHTLTRLPQYAGS
ncbi:glycoprotein [Streptomyces sp. ASQP_92]|uniref:glycoprotein n=1 Tax=Streptomyces sp. ASQP_92 TaxID=2979116 RepID=UPI0021C1AE1E|nr:glycoprotein [Streptomyces sp. ASQP_92]MCT9093940.1 glycoprotein [Streptomyces sp. ASQP_92]